MLKVRAIHWETSLEYQDPAGQSTWGHHISGNWGGAGKVLLNLSRGVTQHSYQAVPAPRASSPLRLCLPPQSPHLRCLLGQCFKNVFRLIYLLKFLGPKML